MSRYSKYNITEADYDLMVFNQGSRCAICQEHCDRLVIDHDHDSGKVRSLLCSGCNTLVGYVEKRGKHLERVEEYINLHKASAVSELQVVGCERALFRRAPVLLRLQHLHTPRG